MSLLLVITSAGQAPTTPYAGHQGWQIKAAGTTTVSTRLGTKELTVAIHAWQVPVEAGPLPKSRPYPQCTYSQDPCSITDWIHVSLDGQDLFVGSFAIAGLGDMHYLAVSGSASQFVIYIGGGDGADSYDARLVFNKGELVERRLYGLDRQHPFEVTRYYAESVE